MSGTLGSFGSILKAFRLSRRLTQQRLADRLGVRRNTIGSWERGDCLPGAKAMVLELARHLRLDDPETRQLLEASLTALSPYWSVPLPRNPYFTGRQEVLGALHRQLGFDHSMTPPHSLALSGLGGVGKTQLALEYAYRYALEYQAVFWIGAGTEEQIISGLLTIAKSLQLAGHDEQNQQRVVTAVHHWLLSHSRWLLIVDNVGELTLLDRLFPAVRSGALLFTTQNPVVGTWARGLDLAPMPQEEGLLFLLRRAKLLLPEAGCEQLRQFAEQHPVLFTVAADLVEVLGGLPLALDQAGAYLEATQCGLPAYLELLHSRRAVLLRNRGERAREHPASVSATFTLALASAAKRHPVVRDLLAVCALLSPEVIPEELFLQGASSLGPPLQSACSDPVEWDSLLAVASSCSLLSRHAQTHTLSLHRLVQAVVLDGMSQQEREYWRRQVTQALDAVFPNVLEANDPRLWKPGERFLPHVLHCLSRPVATDPLLPLAELSSKAAEYLQKRGRYVEAEALCHRALHLWECAVGQEHPQVASALNALALVSWRQGKGTEAQTLYQQALHLWEHAYGPEHPDVAHALNNLAILSVEQGDCRKAELLYLRALHLRERTLGPAHALTGTTLNNLAKLYSKQGKYREAEPLYQRALHIEEEALGTEHPDVAHPMNGLATVYRALGNQEQAERLFHRALTLREQHLGEWHPETAQTLQDLALLRQQQGRTSEALSFVERALAIRAQSLGDMHPHTVATHTLFAQLVQEQQHSVKEESASEHPGEAPVLPSMHEHPPLPTMRIPVRGGSEQVAFTRLVWMRAVTFTCATCGQTVTQLHYPSGRLKYCSDACRAASATQRQEARVARQREKRRITRGARSQAEQAAGM